jgi:hypothetical protein
MVLPSTRQSVPGPGSHRDAAERPIADFGRRQSGVQDEESKVKNERRKTKNAK